MVNNEKEEVQNGASC